MKRIAAIALAACYAVPVLAQSNVGVSIGVIQPGVYGRIDIGNFPQPAVIFPQAIIIAPHPDTVHAQPAYLYVPPEHQKNWARYCNRYSACGQPVYFVQGRWVRARYEEQQNHEHNDHSGKNGKDHNRGNGAH